MLWATWYPHLLMMITTMTLHLKTNRKFIFDNFHKVGGSRWKYLAICAYTHYIILLLFVNTWQGSVYASRVLQLCALKKMTGEKNVIYLYFFYSLILFKKILLDRPTTKSNVASNFIRKFCCVFIFFSLKRNTNEIRRSI